MNSVFEFLLDMILDWDSIEDYTQYYVQPESVRIEIDQSKTNRRMFDETVGPQLWASTQDLRPMRRHDPNSGAKLETYRPLEIYSETDYNQYLETQEPGIGDRAGQQALEADLHRIGY
jgi:hypothetical protein